MCITDLLLNAHGIMYLPQGYLVPLETRVGVLMLSESQLKSLFGNIEKIRVFNRQVTAQHTTVQL